MDKYYKKSKKVKIINYSHSFVRWWYWSRTEGENITVAHSVAKFAMSLSNNFFCNSTNLPPSICEAWFRDMCSLSS